LVKGGKRRIEDLKVGDRVWSINPLTNELVQDEIILMMHNEPNKTAMFFKFETIDGHEVSLTGSHNIPIYDRKEKRLKVIRSSDVTIHDQLIIRGRKIALKNITTHSAQGFYSPLTMTSYLMVNDILTHVFSDNYKVSADTVHLVFTPIRWYYRLTRYLFGDQYQPFDEVKVGLHPIAGFYKTYQGPLRVLVKSPRYILTTVLAMLIYSILRLVGKKEK